MADEKPNPQPPQPEPQQPSQPVQQPLQKPADAPFRRGVSPSPKEQKALRPLPED